MKSKWTFKNLGDVCHVIGGGTPSKDRPDFYGGDIPWATIRDMRQDLITVTEHRITQDALKNSASNVIPEGNVVIATRVGLGKVSMVAQGTAINQDLRGIVPMDRRSMDPRFLFWWAKNVSPLIVKAGTGATVQGVKVPFVKSLKIPIIPISVQRHIVSILDEAFDSIATAKANAEKNLQNARAVFESYLDFAFTKSKWPKLMLGDVCKFVGGSQPPKSVFEKAPSPDNVRLIQIRDYKSDKNIVFIPRSLARRYCTKDDVMIGRYGPPIFQILRGLEGAYNVALMKAEPDGKLITKDFLFYFLKHSAILEYVIFHAERAAGQIGLNKETLEPYPIAVPPLTDQRELVKTIKAIEVDTRRLKSIYQRKLAALDELKQSLLHQAFSGAL